MATSGATSGAPTAPPAVNPDSEMAAPDVPNLNRVRRLTHIEYDNTVRDLLGVDTQPSSGFEADLAQDGFTNNAAGQNVTPALTEQYVLAAESLSEAATANLPGFMGCEPVGDNEAACVQQFIQDFGKRAWRRPLSVEEQERMTKLFNTGRASYELVEAVQMVVQAFLLSPHFIYMLEPSPPGSAPGSIVPLDSWQVASRLSYFLTGSTPDAELLAEAEAGTLATPEAVSAQARRLLTTDAARERIGVFYTEWLRLRNIERMLKNGEMFPNYDLNVASMMLEQVKLFAQSIILDQDGTASDLLTSASTYMNAELAPFYEVQPPSGTAFVEVQLDPSKRAGLLTHVALLAKFAHQDQTDPVHRGKFIRDGILCEGVPPPPVDAVIEAPLIKPGSTTRERFAQHLEEPGCAGCHLLMDPIGLGFEHYDAVGQWRDTDQGLDVDATGSVIGSDVAGDFDGAIELAHKLADSEQVKECFARTWFRFALGRSDLDADKGALRVTMDKFSASGYKMSELLVALTETQGFRYQVVPDPNTSVFGEETTSE